MGVVINIPAALPSVITVPIKPVAQPCDCRNTPTNGPIPDCMSAKKKFRPSKGQSRVDVADGAFLLLAGTRNSSEPRVEASSSLFSRIPAAFLGIRGTNHRKRI
jgi:hypothetical protein